MSQFNVGHKRQRMTPPLKDLILLYTCDEGTVLCKFDFSFEHGKRCVVYIPQDDNYRPIIMADKCIELVRAHCGVSFKPEQWLTVEREGQNVWCLLGTFKALSKVNSGFGTKVS